MGKRPSVRQSDLERAADAVERFKLLGMRPGRVEFGHQGGFTVIFDDGKPKAADDELDAVLAAFEAAHGHD